MFKTHTELRRLATDPFVPTLVRTKIVTNMLKDSSETTVVTKKLLGRFVSCVHEQAMGA